MPSFISYLSSWILTTHFGRSYLFFNLWKNKSFDASILTCTLYFVHALLYHTKWVEANLGCMLKASTPIFVECFRLTCTISSNHVVWRTRTTVTDCTSKWDIRWYYTSIRNMFSWCITSFLSRFFKNVLTNLIRKTFEGWELHLICPSEVQRDKLLESLANEHLVWARHEYVRVLLKPEPSFATRSFARAATFPIRRSLFHVIRLGQRPSGRYLWKQAPWQLVCYSMYNVMKIYHMHTSNDAPMTKPLVTHLRPTNEILGVQNLETSIRPFSCPDDTRSGTRKWKVKLSGYAPLELRTKFCSPDTAFFRSFELRYCTKFQ